MRVKRIVANVQTDIAAAARFYREVLGLQVLMDMGWIAMYGSGSKTRPQISFPPKEAPAHQPLIYPSRSTTSMQRSPCQGRRLCD